MNSRAWQQLARSHIVGRIPGLLLSGSLLHLPDTAWLLRGVAMVASASSDSFGLWAFVQPLYVPADRLVFRYGRRLTRVGDRHQATWPAQSATVVGAEIAASVRAQAMPLLLGVRAPADLLALVRRQPASGSDLDHLEAGAYSAILAEDLPAVQLLGRQMRDLPPALGAEEQSHRMRRVLARFERDAASAVALLRCWRDETAQALRIP